MQTKQMPPKPFPSVRLEQLHPDAQPLSESRVRGTTGVPLLDYTVGQAFDMTVSRFPDREGLVVCEQGVRWTWRELKEKVDAVAAGLLALGLEPGDRVGIWAPNRYEWILTQLATARVGLILVNINPAYRLSELEYALNQVGCKAVITATSFKSSRYLEMLERIMPEIPESSPGRLAAAAVPNLRWVIRLDAEQRPGFLNFDDIVGRAKPEHYQKAEEVADGLDCHDPINIQFTSGTTGLPKAATLTHYNIVNNAFFAGLNMRFGEEDRLCIPVPMYHCFGMVLGVLVCVVHGATVVLPSEAYEAEATLAAVEAERCTGLHGVPTMFIAECEAQDKARFDLTSLRTGIMAGAPCPVELMKRVIRDLHCPEITIGYGMTETSPLSFQTSVDEPIERRVSTVGRVLPHTEVKIVGAEGEIVPIGTPGELLSRGYLVMKGYWNDPEHTASSIDEEGWMHSGDLATLDVQGYCNIVGRLKDMLIRGGENIFPREIEEFLYRHPKIEAVEVFGVPDQKYGEEVCAWIRLREGEEATEEEIRAFCKERIAYYKVPRHIRFVEDFPKTITGKVQKFKMRELMIEQLGVVEEETA